MINLATDTSRIEHGAAYCNDEASLGHILFAEMVRAASKWVKPQYVFEAVAEITLALVSPIDLEPFTQAGDSWWWRLDPDMPWTIHRTLDSVDTRGVRPKARNHHLVRFVVEAEQVRYTVYVITKEY